MEKNIVMVTLIWTYQNQSSIEKLQKDLEGWGNGVRFGLWSSMYENAR